MSYVGVTVHSKPLFRILIAIWCDQRISESVNCWFDLGNGRDYKFYAIGHPSCIFQKSLLKVIRTICSVDSQCISNILLMYFKCYLY